MNRIGFVFGAAGVCIVLFSGMCRAVYAETGGEVQRPNIESCRVINRDNLPKGRGAQGNVIWGNGVLLNWLDVNSDSGIPVETLPGDRMTIVLKGAVRLLADGEVITLSERDCIYLRDGTEYALSPDGLSAEIIELYWPAAILDHSHNDAPFPIGNVTYEAMLNKWNLISMLRPWESLSEKPAGQSQLTEPSLEQACPVNINTLQYCRTEKQPLTRIIQGKRGQACFVRMKPGEEERSKVTEEEQFNIVLEGSVEKTVADSTFILNENDVLYLPKGISHGCKAGDNGCEMLAVLTPANREYTRALRERTAHFHSIIPSGAAPKLCYDGVFGKPGLTFTEGPTWLNGRLYFTNTIVFGERPNSESQGCLYVLNHDGSASILNRTMQVVGTYPLPGGNIAACDFTGNAIVELTKNGKLVRVIADSYEGKTLGGPNDLVVDRKGGIYFTDPWGGRMGDVPGKAVYYIRPDGDVIRLTDWDEFMFPNGCILSPCGSLFYLNTRNRKNNPEIWVYDVLEDGMITNKRKFAEIVFGRTADGLAIDMDGNLYVATGTGGVQIFDKAGGYIGHIHFPKQAQNCVFGDDDLSTLYVTCHSQIYSIQTKMKGYQYPIK